MNKYISKMGVKKKMLNVYGTRILECINLSYQPLVGVELVRPEADREPTVDGVDVVVGGIGDTRRAVK